MSVYAGIVACCAD